MDVLVESLYSELMESYLARVSSKGLSERSSVSVAQSEVLSGSISLLMAFVNFELRCCCDSVSGAAQLKVRLNEGLPNMICMINVKGRFETLQESSPKSAFEKLI